MTARVQAQQPDARSIVCPTLIGRSQLTDSLEQLIADVREGHGQCVSICGEAGIGKSRLVAETRARMSAFGALVMSGHCFEPDATLPYAPILDMLRTCFASRTASEIADCLGPDAPQLVKLLPELTAMIPGLTGAPALDPEQEKRRLLLALAQFFTRLAAKSPLLVTVEDLHWCDDTSLEFLSFVARRIENLPIFLLLTYRSDEVQPALRHVLAQMDRERLIREWPIANLIPAEVDEMIRAIFDLNTPVRSDFLDAIYSLTEGNPFFIEEVLKSLVSSGDIFYADGNWDRKPLNELNIPRSVHDAVRVRTDQLSTDAQKLLPLAAVTGRRFDFALLERISEHSEWELLALIKELMAAQLVVEDSDDQFAFRHALTRHVIYGDLLIRERRALHRTIGENMRQMYAGSIDAHLAELAHHFYEAGCWDDAYYYCRRVGENAQTLFASKAAVEHLTRAIDSAEHLSITPPGKLFRARGQSYELVGEFEAALADYRRALEIARANADGLAEWQALIDLGFLWAGRDYRRTGEFYRKAIELARSLGDQQLIGRSLNGLGNWLVNTGEPQQGRQCHEDALAIFEELGDARQRANTLDLIGMAHGMYGDIRACVSAFTGAIEMYRQLGDDQGLISTLSTRTTYSSPGMHDVTHAVGRPLDERLHDALEAVSLSLRIGWRAGEAFAEITTCSVYVGFGEFREGLRHGEAALSVASEIRHKQWIIGAHFNLGQLYLAAQIVDMAIHHFGQAMPLAFDLGSEWWIGSVTAKLAEAYLLNGQAPRARSILAPIVPEGLEPRTLAQRRILLAWGELALDEHEPETALAIADRLTETTPGGGAGKPLPYLCLLRARALIVLGRGAEAEVDLVAAEREAAERGDRTLLWRLRRELARLYEKVGRREEASAQRAAAQRVIDEIARTIDDERMRGQFLSATALDPSKRPPSQRQAEKAAFGGLTAREREVAALIATGRTNREIAEELVLGERTIETHVTNILSKLQFSSRAQVAAWVVEVRLPLKAG